MAEGLGMDEAVTNLLGDLVRQQNAIAAVARLHGPFGIKTYCGHCSNLGVKTIEWPCETIDTLAQELGVNPKEIF